MLPQLKSGSPKIQLKGSVLGIELSTKNEATLNALSIHKVHVCCLQQVH